MIVLEAEGTDLRTVDWFKDEANACDRLPGRSADKVDAFLATALDTIAGNPEGTAHALVPWICDALLSNHSIKAYGRDSWSSCNT